MTTTIDHLTEKEYMLPGNRTCSGCGLSIAYRCILRALEGQAVMVVPASCLTVLGGMYPTSSVLVPCLNVAFPSTAAAASGVVAGLKALGRTGLTVVAIAGDGGTNDIGLQALSGAAERDTDFIYICYDNEAYMNTGTQRSSSTPLGAKTATTPVFGKQQHSKDLPAIMEAHGVAYIATATSSSPTDLYDKVRKARGMTGTRYIHVSTPCPPGWQFHTKDTVKVGRMALDAGLVVLYEIENGEFRLTDDSKTLAEGRGPRPVEDYIRFQGRFGSIDDTDIAELQRWTDARWAGYLERAAKAG
jgi:pyruvate ferredoxin oxidoreductase beta subunit